MCAIADHLRNVVADAQSKGDTQKARVFYALLQGHEERCNICKSERLESLFGRKVVVR